MQSTAGEIDINPTIKRRKSVQRQIEDQPDKSSEIEAQIRKLRTHANRQEKVAKSCSRSLKVEL